MTKTETHQLTITVNGETRTLTVGRGFWAASDDRLHTTLTTAYDSDDADAFTWREASPFWGRFPTGAKAHLMHGEFDLVVDGALASNPRIRVSRHETCGTDELGRTWRLRTVLYTHNRNAGRLAGWSDKVPADMIAKWR